MTRDEFYEEVASWYDLINFCSDNGCEDFVSDIYDEDARDEYINDCLVDWARSDTWTELYSRLEDIPTGYEYYRNEYGDWEGLDDGDFDDIREEVAEWCDRNGIWDEEEEDEPDEEDDEEDAVEEYVDPEDTIPTEAEDCSFDELFFARVVCVQSIQATARAEEEADEAEFDIFMSAV